MVVTRSQSKLRSQSTRRARSTLEGLPPELRIRIRDQLCSGGPIIYIRGTGINRRENGGALGRPAQLEDLEPSVVVFRRELLSLQRVCRQFYHDMTPKVMKPMKLCIETGVRMSTALDKLGTRASARVGYLKVTFHNARHLSYQTLAYYDHFFDLSPHDVSNRLPGLTKLTLVAPVHTMPANDVYNMSANDVRNHLMGICHQFEGFHPTVHVCRELPTGPTEITWEVTV